MVLMQKACRWTQTTIFGKHFIYFNVKTKTNFQLRFRSILNKSSRDGICSTRHRLLTARLIQINSWMQMLIWKWRREAGDDQTRALRFLPKRDVVDGGRSRTALSFERINRFFSQITHFNPQLSSRNRTKAWLHRSQAHRNAGRTASSQQQRADWHAAQLMRLFRPSASFASAKLGHD